MPDDNVILWRHHRGTPASVIDNLPAPEEIKDIIVIVTTEKGTQVRMSAIKHSGIAYACKALDFEMMEVLREAGPNGGAVMGTDHTRHRRHAAGRGRVS